MAKYIFGIDLGTTYSCISYVDETGRAVVVNNLEGSSTTPSVVNLADPKHVVVGEVAKDNAVMDPENTVTMVKRLIGKTDCVGTFHGEKKSPEEISSYILRKLAGDAAEALGTEVKDVVITCPAYFGTSERTATKNAGEIAGLHVIEIISEPTAAALFYGCSKEQDEKTILVYDLGGGTFDVTVMNIKNDGKIEVVCSDGNHELGGKDWDNKLIDYLLREFESQTGSSPDLQPDEEQDLIIKAEKAKMQLTSKEKTTVAVQAGGERARIELTRDIFNELTDDLLKMTISKTDDAIGVAKGKGFKIDEILLVGGSTRMPQVTKALVDKYGIEPKILDPDQAVAKGAAIYALGAYQHKAEELKEKKERGEINPQDKETREEIKHYLEEATVKTDVIHALRGKSMEEVVTVATTKSYSVAYLDRGLGKSQCLNLIFKNELMENGKTVGTHVFGTNEPNQMGADIRVYETDLTGKNFDIIEEFFIGKAVLELPGNLPEGAPISISLTLNKEGILEVFGKDLTSGNEVRATMQAAKGTILSQEKVSELKSKALQISVE